MTQALFTSSSAPIDRLVAGDYPITTRKVVIDTGALARGAVRGQITATGKFVLSAAAAGDGSEVPSVILAESVDATAADVEAIAYTSGVFDETRVTLGAGHTIASIRDGMRDLGIYFRASLAV